MSVQTPTLIIDAGGNTRAVQLDTGIFPVAAVATDLPEFVLEGKFARMAIEIKNLDGVNALNQASIKARTHPNGDALTYITSAQLNTGTAVTNLLDLVVVNPTTLAAGGKSLIVINVTGLHSIVLNLTGAAAVNVEALATAGSAGR